MADVVRLSSRYRFVASHRLHLDTFSPEQNVRVFGKCNNPHGHGHDYALDITVEGPVGADGQVVNRAEMDALVREHVIAVLDHKNLNKDVTEFAALNPTTENLMAVIHARLARHWTLPARLVRVTIIETPKNTFAMEAAK